MTMLIVLILMALKWFWNLKVYSLGLCYRLQYKISYVIKSCT